jgi:TolB-like protein/class 3 adenylate cyclase/Tfp pilus assembly protein PilF
MRYAFGGFVLDLDRYELRRGDEPVEIQPKAFDVLRYLVENAGRTVTKEELLERVWPGVVVAESSLTQAVFQARRALGDQDGEGSIVRTVRRRGYALGVPVERAPEVASATAPAPDAAEAADAPGAAERRLAALLSADVVEYTRHMARDDVATVRRLREYRERLVRQVAAHRGRVIDSPGDNVLAEFPSAFDAAACAVAAQRELATHNEGLPADGRMELRIGVHLGDVLREGGALYGDGVNVAARIERLAQPGGVAVSELVYAQVRNRLDVPWTDLGEQRLRNVDHPVRVRHFHPTAPVASAAPQAAKDRKTLRFNRPRALRLALGAALVLFLAWLARPVPLWAPAKEETGPRAPLDRSAIAVLPFADLSARGDQAYLAEGISEELIHTLSQRPGLRVVARTSSFAFGGSAADVREIAEKLRAGTVVEGSIRREQGRLRVTVQLIDAIDGFHLWSESYDRRADDVFALQKELAATLADKLTRELGLAVGGARADAYEPTPEAYDAYLVGRAEANLRTEESLRRAVEHLERAAEIDPAYAAAHAELARAHLQRAEFVGAEAHESARRAAARAAELDPTLPEALATLAHLRRAQADWAGAETLYRQALAQNPGWADGWEQYGSFLAYVGRLDEALAAILRGLELDPLSPVIQRQAGRLLYYSGATDRGIAHLLRSLELNPGEEYAASLLWMAYEQKGMSAEAREAMLLLAPGWTRPPLRIVGRIVGTTVVLRVGLAVARRLSPPCTWRPTSVVLLLAWVGDADGMFQCLDFVIDRAGDLNYVKVHPFLDRYRADPRMVQALARAGLE